jgi:hypothetical protein
VREAEAALNSVLGTGAEGTPAHDLLKRALSDAQTYLRDHPFPEEPACGAPSESKNSKPDNSDDEEQSATEQPTTATPKRRKGLAFTPKTKAKPKNNNDSTKPLSKGHKTAKQPSPSAERRKRREAREARDNEAGRNVQLGQHSSQHSEGEANDSSKKFGEDFFEDEPKAEPRTAKPSLFGNRLPSIPVETATTSTITQPGANLPDKASTAQASMESPVTPQVGDAPRMPAMEPAAPAWLGQKQSRGTASKAQKLDT